MKMDKKWRYALVLLFKIVGAMILLALVILGFLWLATPDVSGFKN